MKALCPPETYRHLAELAETVMPGEVVVELGTYAGHGTVNLIEHTRATVVTVDTHDLPGERHSTAVGPSAKRLNFTDPRIRIEAEARIAGRAMMIQGDSVQVGQGWTGPEVGMLVIDADHREGAVRRDFAAWEPHLSVGAWVCFDDYHPERYPGVVRVVQRLIEKKILAVNGVYGTLAVLVKQ